MKNACDCHVHVFGPTERYPYWPGRTYTPPEASVAQLLALHAKLGIERVVIVQASVYGSDNSCTVDALQRLGKRARAVAVIDESSDLEKLHAAGVRGVRLNLHTAGQHDPEVARRLLREAASRVAPLGWHVQMLTTVKVISAIGDVISSLETPVVVDHFGLPQRAAEFDSLVSLVRSGKAYVKLSAPQRFPLDPAPLAKALIEANPDRMLWGTDWPHPGVSTPRTPHGIHPFDAIDDARALARLAEWAPDAKLRQKILVENPARLYDFQQEE